MTLLSKYIRYIVYGFGRASARETKICHAIHENDYVVLCILITLSNRHESDLRRHHNYHSNIWLSPSFPMILQDGGQSVVWFKHDLHSWRRAADSWNGDTNPGMATPRREAHREQPPGVADH